jgi:transcriptional repressor NrdR
MTQVEKRTGNKETFDPEKFRRAMLKAAIDAGYTLEGMVDLTLIDEITEDVVEEAQEKGEIRTYTIRKRIINKLERAESSIADSWKRFERKYK